MKKKNDKGEGMKRRKKENNQVVKQWALTLCVTTGSSAVREPFTATANDEKVQSAAISATNATDLVDKDIRRNGKD